MAPNSLRFAGLVLVALLATGCQKAQGMANPASTNCIDSGGNLRIETRGDGGEYGVCHFSGNRQCEEWAMLRGDCPKGGIPVDAAAPRAAQYCVISGGRYSASSSASSGSASQGQCTLPGGKTCGAVDYYDGKC